MQVKVLLYVSIVALAALVVVAAVDLFKRFRKNASGVPGGISAFAKVATASIKQTEAQGKLVALKAATDVQKAAADALKQTALDAHAAIDEAHETFDEVHKILG